METESAVVLVHDTCINVGAGGIHELAKSRGIHELAKSRSCPSMWRSSKRNKSQKEKLRHNLLKTENKKSMLAGKGAEERLLR